MTAETETRILTYEEQDALNARTFAAESLSELDFEASDSALLAYLAQRCLEHEAEQARSQQAQEQVAYLLERVNRILEASGQ